MENIETILAGIEGLTEEQAAAIKKGVGDNYRTIAEVQGKGAKLEAATKQIEELQAELAKAKELDGSNAEQMEAFRAKIEELEKAAADRKASEDAAAKRDAFAKEFGEATKDKAFANDLTKQAVFDKAFELRGSNPDMAFDAVLSQVTDGMEGIWANPQRDPHKQPAGAQGGTSPITSKDQLKGMSAAEINANWDTVKELLKN